MWTPRERPCLRPRAATRDSPTPHWLVPAHLPGRSHPQPLTCTLGPTKTLTHLPLYLSESAPSTLTYQRPPPCRTLTDEAFDGRSRARRNATFPSLSKPRRDKTRHIWHCGTRSPKCRGRVCSPRSSLQVTNMPPTPRIECDPGHMCAMWVHLHRQAPQQALLLRGVPASMESRPSGHLPRVRSALHSQPLQSGVLHGGVQGAVGQTGALRARP